MSGLCPNADFYPSGCFHLCVFYSKCCVIDVLLNPLLYSEVPFFYPWANLIFRDSIELYQRQKPEVEIEA